MTWFDKVLASVMPPESDADRAEARRKSEMLSGQHGWLAMALDHHRQIEAAFAAALNGIDTAGRKQAAKHLGVILTGHAGAEESVLYPGFVITDDQSHATMGYQEQAMVKVQMAELEQLDPMSQEWTDKLEHIQGAVAHHMYEEEGTWFPDLAEKAGAQSEMLTQRFAEEFQRYAGREIAEPLSELA